MVTGGAERLVCTLHHGLLEKGVASHLLGLEQQETSTLPNTLSMNLGSSYNPFALIKIWRFLKKSTGPNDVVHAHLFPSNLYVSVLKQLGVISVSTFTTEHSTSNSRRGTILGSFIDYFVYRGFDRIFAISSGAKDKLVEWKPWLSSKIEVIPNGIQPRFNQALVRKDKEALVILSIGHLREAKNYKAMLAALADLTDENFEYWIAGEGKEQTALERYATVLGLGNKVRFLGYVSDLRPVLLEADIFLMASRWEGFGLAAVEAMNASLPVIASDVSGLREVVSSSAPCAILVDPRSTDQIAQAVLRLLHSKKERDVLGANGFERSNSFTAEKMIESYLNAYSKYTLTT